MCTSCIVPTSPSVHDLQGQNSTVLCRIFQILSSWVSHPKSTIFLCHLNLELFVFFQQCTEYHNPHCSNLTVYQRPAPVQGMRPAYPSLSRIALCCQISL